jgi:hypothetical protein
MPELAVVGAEIGFEILEKVVPKGFAWVRTKFFGEKIMAIGEPRAGKTSFIRYLAYGLLFPMGPVERTTRERHTVAFEIGIGRDRAMRMSVSKGIDTSGHSEVRDQIRGVVRRKPTILLIFLNGGRPWPDDDEDGIGYLTRVLEELNKTCARNDSFAQSLKHVAVVLNKIDLLNDNEVNVRLRKIRECIRAFRSPSFADRADSVAIYKCISVEHDTAKRILDSTIKSIMTEVIDRND